MMTFPPKNQNETTQTFNKVTLYHQSEILGSYQATRVRRVTCTIAPYAQHKRSLHVRFIPKGKRNQRGFVTQSPTILIVDGWNTPDPPGDYDIVRSTGEITVRQSRYLSHDPRWVIDFNEWLSAQEVKILADFRTTPTKH